MLEDAVQLISQVGYPITISLILMWYIKVEQDKTQELLRELSKNIQELITTIKAREEVSKHDS